MEHFRLGYNARVGIETGVETSDEIVVTLKQHRDNDWQIEMSPWVTRDLIKRLKKMADLIDPPKPRRRG